MPEQLHTPPLSEHATARGRLPGWWIGPTMLVATVSGVILLRRGLEPTFAWALAALVGTALVWFLVSIFWPARPDRTCPACGARALRRLNSDSTRGVACDRCGHRDEHQSSFLLAEDEEGSIESIVIQERHARRGPLR